MSLKSQKRMAASVLNIGQSRLWINPEELAKVESAITKEEIRRLIHEGVITAKPKRGISRGRSRTKAKRKIRRGSGSKKSSTRIGKQAWVIKIRTFRARLKELKNKRIITTQVYRRLLPMAKGGVFRNISHLNEYIETHNLARRR